MPERSRHCKKESECSKPLFYGKAHSDDDSKPGDLPKGTKPLQLTRIRRF